jgi:hypothetical protein
MNNIGTHDHDGERKNEKSTLAAVDHDFAQTCENTALHCNGLCSAAATRCSRHTKSSLLSTSTATQAQARQPSKRDETNDDDDGTTERGRCSDAVHHWAGERPATAALPG